MGLPIVLLTSSLPTLLKKYSREFKSNCVYAKKTYFRFNIDSDQSNNVRRIWKQNWIPHFVFYRSY